MHKPRLHLRLATGLLPVWLLVIAPEAPAATRTWLGNTNTWDTNAFNWTGLDEPDPDDDAFFNGNALALMGIDNVVRGVFLLDNSTLLTQDRLLRADQQILLSDSSRIVIGGNDLSGLRSPLAQTQSLDVLGNSTVDLGGDFTLRPAGGTTRLLVDRTSEFRGNGEVRILPSVAATTPLFQNDGTIVASETFAGIVLNSAPRAQTLEFFAPGNRVVLDLDGRFNSVAGLEEGGLRIERQQTLRLVGNIRQADDFSGTLVMKQDSTFDSVFGLDIDSNGNGVGRVLIDNGFEPGIGLFPSRPAGPATIRGGTFSIDGGEIDIVDPDGELRFEGRTNILSSTIRSSGLVAFGGVTNVDFSSTFKMDGPTASLEVGGLVQIRDPDFDIDAGRSGGGTLDNRLEVRPGGSLSISQGPTADTELDGTIAVDSGRLQISRFRESYTLNGVIDVETAAGEADLTFSDLRIGDGITGNGFARLDVDGGGTATISATNRIILEQDSNVAVGGGSTLRLSGELDLRTRSAFPTNSFTVDGTLLPTRGIRIEDAFFRFGNGSAPGNYVLDLDGLGRREFDADLGSANDVRIGPGGRLLVDVDELLPYGYRNDVSQTVLRLNADATGEASITLNTGNQWQLREDGRIEFNGSTTPERNRATLQSNANPNLDGDIDVRRGDATLINAFVLGGTIDVEPGSELLLRPSTNPFAARPDVTLAGGTLTGGGRVVLEAQALRGAGAIDTEFRASGGTEVVARDGTLRFLRGPSSFDLPTLSAEPGGTLRFDQFWNTGAAERVDLRGGEIAGSAIFNDNNTGLSGFGTVSAFVVNAGEVIANGGTLRLTGGADLDGTSGSGILTAEENATLISEVVATDTAFRGRINGKFGSEIRLRSPLQVEGQALLGLDRSRLELADGSALGTSPGSVTLRTAFRNNAGATAMLASDGRIDLRDGLRIDLGQNLAIDAADARIRRVDIRDTVYQIFNRQNLQIIEGLSSGASIINLGNLEISGDGRAGTPALALPRFRQTPTGSLTLTYVAADDRWRRLENTGDVLLEGTLSLAGGTPAFYDPRALITSDTVINGRFDAVDGVNVDANSGLAVTYTATEVLVQRALLGDATTDGAVNLADFAALGQNFGTTRNGWAAADFTGEGEVNLADFAAIGRNFGAVSGTAPNAADRGAAAEAGDLRLALDAATGALLLVAADRGVGVSGFEVAADIGTFDAAAFTGDGTLGGGL